MDLPIQIREKMRAVAAYEAALQEPSAPAPEAPEASEAPAAPEAPVVPEPVQSVHEPAPVPSESAPAPEPAASGDDDEERWAHKYRRLQGKYDAEVPRLHDEIKQLRNAVDSLRQIAAEAQAQAASRPAEHGREETRLVTEADVEAFGEDLVDLARRAAREVMQRELETLRAENSAVKQQVTAVKATTFQARLAQAIPDFAEINQSQEWIDWLNAYDPLLRGPRRVVAELAYNAEDVDGVKNYVDLFRATQAAPAADQARRQAELRKQIQPPRAGSSAVPAPQGQARVYTAKEASAGYERVRKLLASGRIDEASALEQEISAAYMDGRVRG